MSFKKRLFLLSASLSFLGLMSCRWVGEDKYIPKTIEIKNEVESCFDGFSVTLEKYLKSEIEDEEVEYFFNCTERSIDDFMRKTAERDPTQGYSRDEVRGLLEKFLSRKESNIDGDKYARLFLIFKRMLIGGEQDYLSRQDWARIKENLPVIKQFFIDTKPYTQYYYFYNKLFYQNKRHDVQRIDISHKELEKRLIEFVDYLKENGSRLNKLEIQFLKDELVSNESLKAIEPLLNEIVYIFYSFPASQHQENWTELLMIAEKGLRVMTFVKKSLFQSESFFLPQGGVGIVAMVRSIIDVFDAAIKANSNLNLDQELFEKFILSLYHSGIFLQNVEKPEDIVSFVSNVGKSFFSYENGQKWYLSNLKINQFKFLYNRWVWSLINSIENTSSWDLKEKYEDLLYENIDFDSNSEKEGEDIFANIVEKSAVNLVSPGVEFKMNFRKSNYNNPQDAVSAQFYKTMLSNVVLLIFDTYGKQSRIDTNASKHVSEQTSSRFYNDIRPIAISEGLGNPLTCDAGGRTFLEANLFAFSANGNDKIEVQEALEWLSMAASSSSVASRIFNDIAEKSDCILPENTRFLNKPYLKKTCVRSQILENYHKYFNHMPNLVRFIETQNKIEDLYQNLFEVTRTCADSDLPVSYDEIIYSVTLLGYIEGLFDRYDVAKTSYFVFERPQNDLLEMDELHEAFEQRFKSILQRIVKLQFGRELSDSHTEHLFKKLLIYKKLPETPSGNWEGLLWLLQDRAVNVRPLNRIDIYKIFNSILTLNEMPEVSTTYCRNLSLAWEEYLQQQVFELKVPINACEVPPAGNVTGRDRRNTRMN